MVYSKERCSRVVNRSKYERGDPNRVEFWNSIFQALESDAALPPDYRYEVLKETLSEKTLCHIQRILEVVKDESRLPAAPTPSTTTSSSTYSTSNKSTSAETIQSHGHIPDIPLDVPPPVENRKPNLRLGVSCGNVGPKNAYVNFFKRPAERAAVWRPLPPPSLETMNLTQKAEAVTKQIAEDFSKWMEGISAEGEPVLQPATIMRMFDYEYKNHAATSLCVQIRELPSVAQTVAEKTNFSWKSKSSALKVQIRRDVKASQKKKRTVAFGSAMPRKFCSYPPKIDTKRWRKCENIHEELGNMSTVWDGITHLRTTMAFSLYVLKRGKVPFPKFLEERHLKDRAYLEECLRDATFFEPIPGEDSSIDQDMWMAKRVADQANGGGSGESEGSYETSVSGNQFVA